MTSTGGSDRLPKPSDTSGKNDTGKPASEFGRKLLAAMSVSPAPAGNDKQKK